MDPLTENGCSGIWAKLIVKFCARLGSHVESSAMWAKRPLVTTCAKPWSMNWMMLVEVLDVVLPIVNDPDSNSIVPPVEQFAQLTVRPAGLRVAKVSKLQTTMCLWLLT